MSPSDILDQALALCELKRPRRPNMNYKINIPVDSVTAFNEEKRRIDRGSCEGFTGSDANSAQSVQQDTRDLSRSSTHTRYTGFQPGFTELLRRDTSHKSDHQKQHYKSICHENCQIFIDEEDHSGSSKNTQLKEQEKTKIPGQQNMFALGIEKIACLECVGLVAVDRVEGEHDLRYDRVRNAGIRRGRRRSG
ncbi:hypothetical protein M5K25_017378 [Dendrobium thyrsiflorum]|uniref:Uncharacterized protein n=1 Tax=Dendrobium thyrsiflorum TaxID=117978 RepID=A0ABD0UUC9_DENTH